MPAAGLTIMRSLMKRCSPGGTFAGCGCSPASVASSESRSSWVLTETALALGAMRLIVPVRTLPGPISTKVVTPSSTRRCTLCRQRTGLTSWADSNFAQSSGSSWPRASMLAMTGTSGERSVASAMALRRASRAGAMNGVWNAPPTGSGMTFLAPSSLAAADARPTPSGDPAMTTWPGALKLATHASPSARRQATSQSSSSRPSTAAIVPGLSSAAACMASPRSTTVRTPSSNDSAPVAVSAEYSPRL